METKNLVNFTGGFNCVDSELNMNEKYLTEALNCELGYDSTIKKRNGFKLIKNLYDSMNEGEKITEIFYFNQYAILYTNKGRVLQLDDKNVLTVIWDETIASGLKTTIWNHPEKRCFGAAAGDMFILSNGYDKPLQICYNLSKPCQYLHDPATGSNANVPVIYKCVMINHYLCASCLFTTKTIIDPETQESTAVTVPDNTIRISAKNAPGVWGDPDVAEYRDLGCANILIDNIVGMDNQNIIDICSFKNELCVMTDYCIIFCVLDKYEEEIDQQSNEDGTIVDVTVSVHRPYVDTVVDNAGATTSGSIQLCYDDIAFLSANGINSIKRNVVSQNMVPESLSFKILPYVKSKFESEQNEYGVHSIIDRGKFVYMLKWSDDTMLCMSFHPNLSEKCFYIWNNIRYVSFASNVYGRILATDGYGVFIYASDDEERCYDEYIDDSGNVVKSMFNFSVTTPWLFFSKPSNVKTMHYIKVYSDGKADFKFNSLFDLSPDIELTVDLVGGSNQGYGAGSNPNYGGGIITSNEELIDYSQAFMYNKFNITSNDGRPLRITCISVNYTVGGIRR